MAKKLWYTITAKAQAEKPVVEIRIYDEISFWGTTAEAFVAELDAAAAGGADIVVSLNSPGGDVFDALAIYNALRRYAGRVTTRVDGFAASAASLIAMAGDQLIMPENAQLMIHNAWTIAGGTAEDLRSTADMMDRVRDGVVAAYSRKSGQDADKIVEMMDATTWMSALEAQALGFCDLIEDPVRLQMSSDLAAEVLRKHKNLPAEVSAMLDALEAESPCDPAPPPATTTDAPPLAPPPSLKPMRPRPRPLSATYTPPAGLPVWPISRRAYYFPAASQARGGGRANRPGGRDRRRLPGRQDGRQSTRICRGRSFGGPGPGKAVRRSGLGFRANRRQQAAAGR